MGESNCNWQEDEKVQLCNSWARVTVCLITGKSISLSKLWEKIFSDYMENWCGPTNRTPSALQSQFRHLKKCSKIGIMHKFKPAIIYIASGHNLMDQMNQAQTIYMKHHPKEFDKWACWEKVKYHPYFADPPSKERASDSPSTNEHPLDLDNDEVMETTPTSSIRPPGRKRSKEAMRKGNKEQDVGSSLALSIQSMAEATQASVELVRQRNEEIVAHSKKVMEFEAAKEDARIMGMDTSKMSPDEKQWWKAKKRSVMVKTNMARTLFDDGNNDCYTPQFN